MEIKINLEIGLSPALQVFLSKVLNTAPASAPTAPPVKAEAPRTVQEESRALAQAYPVEDPQPEAQRRTRRTKAQIAADEAADASGSRADRTDAGSAETSDEDGGLAEALGLVDEAPAPAGAVTKAMVTEAITKAVEVTGNPKQVQEAMFASTGFKSVGSMDPDKYEAAHEALLELVNA